MEWYSIFFIILAVLILIYVMQIAIGAWALNEGIKKYGKNKKSTQVVPGGKRRRGPAFQPSG
jgi:uncharacterized protein YpmS